MGIQKHTVKKHSYQEISYGITCIIGGIMVLLSLYVLFIGTIYEKHDNLIKFLWLPGMIIFFTKGKNFLDVKSGKKVTNFGDSSAHHDGDGDIGGDIGGGLG